MSDDSAATGEVQTPAAVDPAAIGAASIAPALDDIKERLTLVRMNAQTDAQSGNPAYQLKGLETLALLDAVDHLIGA
jgi:hypothetical protein